MAVDSRKARRELQTEIPGEVFDASTTGVTGIVLHHHIQPLTTACLSCIYYEDVAENQYTKTVADGLGLSLEDMAKMDIDKSMSDKIKSKYPHLEKENIEGTAVSTLYKQLCGEQLLTVSEGTQVLAPLSFVSVMAGTYLAIEFVRRIAGGTDDYNSWQLHPWLEPTLRTKKMLPRLDNCESCNKYEKYYQRFWSGIS